MRKSTVENAREGFTAHAALYLLVMAALIVLNFTFLTGSWWSGIPLVAGASSWACTTCTCGASNGPTPTGRRTGQRAATAKPAV